MRRHGIYNIMSTKPKRKTLRSNLTSAEATLWRCLKGSGLDGRKFRRQHGIGRYIVDFYCPSAKLIVELDGAPHRDVIRAERDIARTRFLEGRGFRVIRFENREVFENIEFVLEEIRRNLTFPHA